MSNIQVVRGGFWDTTIGHRTTTQPVTTGSAWMLALLPAFYLGFVALAFTATVTDPLVHALFAALFYLAGVALAAVDEHVLRVDGHPRTASPYVALFGAVPYLIARTRHLVDETGRGTGVMWVGILTLAGGALTVWLLLG